MLISPKTLSLITTHQCTAACDHCCFGCTPQVKAHIPVSNLHKYIDQATDVPSLMVVVFTGGECFLLGSDLDDLVERANRHGFLTRFVSNGYWATSPRTARARIERLVSRGLKEANFSTGEVHGEYVKPEYVRHGAVAAADAGLTTVVTIEVFRDMGFDIESFMSEPDFHSHVEAGRIIVKCSPWMKFEGKRELTYSHRYVQMLTENNSACSTSLNVIAINPSEHLISCCGLTLEEIDEVHLGDLRKHTIREILDAAPNDFIKFWIHVEGPRAVIKYAMQYDASITPPPDMAHICEACRFMYHDERIAAAIRDNPPPNVADIMRRYFSTLLFNTTSQGSSDVHSQALDTLRRSCTRQSVDQLVSLVTE